VIKDLPADFIEPGSYRKPDLCGALSAVYEKKTDVFSDLLYAKYGKVRILSK
jgi:hypothetical protein